MAAGDLTDLATVKAWLGVTDTSQDAILERLITTATEAIQEYILYPVLTGSRSETFNGKGKDMTPLSNWPITAVSSVTVNDTAIPARAGATGAGYTFDSKFLYLQGYSFTKGQRNVVVNYTSGYDTVPPIFVQACLATIQDWLGDQGKDGAVTSYSVPGVYSESYTPIADRALPEGVKQMLKKHVRDFAP